VELRAAEESLVWVLTQHMCYSKLTEIVRVRVNTIVASCIHV
jgi:hypothetical protein